MRRMILPILKKYWKLLLSAMLVSALGCGIMVGMSSAYISLDGSLADYVRDYRYPSAVITTEVVNRSRIESLASIPGVTAVDARLCGDTYMIDTRGRYLSVRVFSCNEGDLQRFHVWEEAEAGDRDSVRLEYNFAVDNGIEAGDEVSFRVGEEYRVYFVEALVSAPETLSVQITDDSWGVNTDFGYAYVSVDLLVQESEKERDEARSELDARSSELSDARETAEEGFQSGREQLDQAKALLDEKDLAFEEASREAEEQKKRLSDTAAELRRTRRQLEDNIRQLESAERQLRAAKPQLEDGIEKLEQAKSALAEIDRNLSELHSSLDRLNDPQVAEAIQLLRSVPANTQLSTFFDNYEEFDHFLDLARQNGFVIDEDAPVSEAAGELSRFITMAESDYAYLNSPEIRALIARAANGEDISTDPEYPHLVEVISRYDETYHEGGDIVAGYNNAMSSLSRIHQEVENGNINSALLYITVFGQNVTLSEFRAEVELLRQLRNALSEAQGRPINTVGELIIAYEDTKTQLTGAIAELEAQRAEIVSALAAQGVQENQIDSKLRELRSQLSEVNTQLDAIPGAIRQLRDGIAEIDEALAQIDEAIAEIDARLASAEELLNEAHEEYDSSVRSFNERYADTMREFSDLDDELRNAYAQLEEGEGYEALCNQFLLYFDPDMDPSLLLRAAEAVLSDVTVKKGFIYEDSAVKNRIDINLAPIDTMSTFMPMVFFIVILIVVFLFMSLVIRQCRREIGILRALGFTAGRIRLLYCGVDLVVSLLAIVLGVCLGLGVMRYIGHYYQAFFPLPFFNYRVNFKTLLLAAALTILVGQAATLIGTTVISKISPSEAMTRPAPVSFRIPRLIAALTKNAKPMVKFSVSSLLRNKTRFLFSVICVAASVMMIFSSFAFITSKNHILRELYDERIHYDCQLFFDEQPDEETVEALRALPFVSDLQPLVYYEAEIAFNGRSESGVVNAMEPDTELVHVFGADGSRLEVPEDGVILEAHLAKSIGAGVGDSVSIDGVPFRVDAVSDQSVSRFHYISTAAAERLEGESLGCLILNIDEADEQKLLAHLTETDGYLYSVFTRLSYAGNAKVFRTYDIATSIIIVFAILIGLTIVYNTTQTNLLEKKKELCVLRTLGFQRGEISKSWFVQSLLQFLCSCAVGLPVGIIVAKTALGKISTPGREYVFANGPKEYIFTAVLVFAYIVLSHLLAMNSLKHWNIVETVKEKE